jgi:hypothetical protein
MRINVLSLAFILLIGCWASILPPPELQCVGTACVVRVKPGNSVELSVRLILGGESMDQRTFALNATPTVSGLTLEFKPSMLLRGEMTLLTIRVAGGLATGNYHFMMQATAGSDVISSPLLVIVEP